MAGVIDFSLYNRLIMKSLYGFFQYHIQSDPPSMKQSEKKILISSIIQVKHPIMNDRQRSTSLGTVIAFGFILLGILNLVGAFHYKKPSPISASRMPALLFIATGLIILIIKAIKKTRER
jgi:hypothetical protein